MTKAQVLFQYRVGERTVTSEQMVESNSPLEVIGDALLVVENLALCQLEGQERHITIQIMVINQEEV